MSLTARDLPPEIRRQLLDQLRNQLGPMRYNQLVGARGEDGVVNAVLQAMAAQSSASGPAAPSILGSSSRTEEAATRWAAKIRNAIGWVLMIGVILFLSVLGFSVGEWAKLPGYQKLLIGLTGIVVDVVFIGLWAWEAQSNPSPPAPRSSASAADPTGCLDLLAALWNLLLALPGYFFLVVGAVGGPVLLVWGIVDLCR